MFKRVVQGASIGAVIALLSAQAASANVGGQGTVAFAQQVISGGLHVVPMTNPRAGEIGAGLTPEAASGTGAEVQH